LILEIKRKFKHFLQDSAMTLFWGQLLVQIIMLGSLPFISRVFTVQEVGNWGVFQALGMFLWSFSQLKTDNSLIQAEETEEKKQLACLGLILHSLFSTFALLIFSFTKMGQTLQTIEFCYLGGFLLGLGGNMMLHSLFLSQRAYRSLSLVRIFNAFLSYPFALILSYLGIKNGLLIALILGVWLPILGSLLAFGKRINTSFQFLSLHSSIHLLKKYQKNSVWGSINAFTSGLNDQFWVLMVAHFFQADMVAAYYMASRVCNAPISLMNASYGQHNFRHFQELERQGKFTVADVWAFWKKWMPVGLLFYGLLFCLGEVIFTFILGEKWAFSGQLVSILAIYGFLVFLTSPTSCGFTVIHQQKKAFYLTILAILLGFGAFCGLFWKATFYQIICIYTILVVLHNLFFNILLLRATRTRL
jgi:O-antigen/teichoic acid export membrane protein